MTFTFNRRTPGLAVRARPALGSYFLFLTLLRKSGINVERLYSVMFFICFCFIDIFLPTLKMSNNFLNSTPIATPRIVSPIPCSIIVVHKLAIVFCVFTFGSGEIPSEAMFWAEKRVTAIVPVL